MNTDPRSSRTRVAMVMPGAVMMHHGYLRLGR
jgi:hypothetical protein